MKIIVSCSPKVLGLLLCMNLATNHFPNLTEISIVKLYLIYKMYAFLIVSYFPFPCPSKAHIQTIRQSLLYSIFQHQEEVENFIENV